MGIGLFAVQVVVWNVFTLSAPQVRVFTFDEGVIPPSVKIEGDVRLDDSNKRGTTGRALRVGPGGKVVWSLRGKDGFGTVDFWVYEDGSAKAEPKKYGSGALWGLAQQRGPVLAVGVVYAPYLSGDRSYCAADFDPRKGERPWWEVQYLGTRRVKGWHRWTFSFEPGKGLSILFDGRDVNAKRKRFKWNKTRLKGFSGIVFFGDTTDAKQVLWIDDVKVELGPLGAAEPLWPPPPPSDLVPFVPEEDLPAAPYARWENGPGSDPGFFPIAVWLQDPRNARRYKQAGFNLYVGLWKGPTEKQLRALREAGMRVICDQNEVALAHFKDGTIAGWMHGDEPDNAQRVPGGKGYGPPIPPEKIVERYREIVRKDPTRPVLLNLGQGVAWDKWHGRGVRTNHPEDYPRYIQGCDIVSFDIYPVVHRSDEVRGNLWYVARGVQRLRRWSNGKKIVWNCLECTRISNPNVKPTPHQVRSEAWMAVIFGSRGLIYFVHQFKPTFIEAGLLADKEMLRAVSELNGQIHSLAPVINSPTLRNAVSVVSSSPHTPIRTMVKRRGGMLYVFSVALWRAETTGTFEVPLLRGREAEGEVLFEGRKVRIRNGVFKDRFRSYDVHIYRIPLR